MQNRPDYSNEHFHSNEHFQLSVLNVDALVLPHYTISNLVILVDLRSCL